MTADKSERDSKPDDCSDSSRRVPLEHTASAETAPPASGAKQTTGRQNPSSSDQPRSAGNHPGEAGGEMDHERFVFTPPIDIFETEEGLVLHADLPGVSVETLDLQVQDNKLTLFGRVRSSLPAGARPLHCEYEEGDFLRSFILSDEVNHESISATMSNGVLKVVLPRASRVEPRKIQVSTDP